MQIHCDKSVLLFAFVSIIKQNCWTVKHVVLYELQKQTAK